MNIFKKMVRAVNPTNERSLLELLTVNGITTLTADIEETRERGYSYDLLV